MEHHRPPKRSQSHGALRTGYARHGRPLHKPLVRVNENSALLASPGALESMLKTTTETGDIGLYSIKSVPGANLLPPGVKSIAGNTRRPPHPPHRPVDDAGRHEGRRKPYSNRDTTSEIISMYGSNSQSSGTSTRAPSSDEPGQRSCSMTTVGSKQLSHNRSNATLQSRTSSGPLQRPRSPFPYPTRLKRPGARPVSPAVTDAGIVDYSRMVEIDRISLRTGHGHLKSPYPYSRRRPPPLGIRSDANLSTPSLPSNGPPPVRRLPGHPSVRTASSASISSCTAPHGPPYRDRVYSPSTRTSSLTSVVNMYYRMPPALKAAQFGPSPPPPRYYDYTEEFENRESQLSTPLEPVAPVPTRASSSQRPLVLREGSEEELAAALGVEVDSAFFDTESQQDEYGDETELCLRNDAEATAEPSTQERNSARKQTSHKGGTTTPVVPSLALGGRKITRGSDIDMLPSQVGRVSVDTFCPSLDVESRDAPLFSYPNFRQRTSKKTSTPSPARQVQVHDGRTPTICSEQGVILRGDTRDDITSDGGCGEEEDRRRTEDPKGGCTAVQRLDPGRSKSDSACDILSMPSTVHGASMPIRRIATADPFGAEESQVKLRLQVQKPSNKVHTDMEHGQGGPSSDDEAMNIPNTSPTGFLHSQNEVRETNRQIRSHRRNHAVLRISSKILSQDDEDVMLLCSNPPLVSPKPISPARELKVKNSIPKLMKELPPLPGEARCLASSTPVPVGDDECFKILKPHEFSRSATPTGSVAPRDPVEFIATNQAKNTSPDTQQKLPKIRVKPKVNNGGLTTNLRDSRPWNSESNYPWCNKAPDVELVGMNGGQDNMGAVRQRLKLRKSRLVGGDMAYGTVRQNPEARKSDMITKLANQPPKDLFSFSTSLTSVFRQVSSKLSYKTTSTSYDTPKSNSSRDYLKGLPHIVLPQTSGRRLSSISGSENDSAVQHRRGMRKHLSNLGWLLARPSHARLRGPPVDKVEILHGKQRAGLESTFGLYNIDFESKNFTTSEGITLETQPQPRFRRRLKAKISKWVRGTKAAVKSCRKGGNGIETI